MKTIIVAEPNMLLKTLLLSEKIALQILTQNDDKNSIKKRRHIAAWNDMYLLKLIQPLF
ncbi:MAG: hypothetical protein IPN25_11550 [Sphingobacteriales bacterium]|nr:hypothetical protein [Sphingobacteriales bacterium]